MYDDDDSVALLLLMASTSLCSQRIHSVLVDTAGDDFVLPATVVHWPSGLLVLGFTARSVKQHMILFFGISSGLLNIVFNLVFFMTTSRKRLFSTAIAFGIHRRHRVSCCCQCSPSSANASGGYSMYRTRLTSPFDDALVLWARRSAVLLFGDMDSMEMVCRC